PRLAAGLADVLVPDHHPLVALRLEQHLLDPAAVELLDVGAVAEHPAVVLEPIGQLVAQLLELYQRQHARPAARGDLPVESRPRGSTAPPPRSRPALP